MNWLAAKIVRVLLALRYHLTIKETDLTNEKGILFIPNHPAEMDPVILMSYLAPRFHPRPLVVDHFYYLTGVRFFMRFVRALPIPNFETSTNAWKVKRARKIYHKIHEGLARGDNFLIYPSGHLKREAQERMGGSMIHDLLQKCPKAKVVFVRTSGMWGSRFSRALTGQVPSFWQELKASAWVLLKNGIFFVPKRDVNVELCMAPEDFPRSGTRMEINHYLEKWLNRYVDEKGNVSDREPLKRVSYSRFREELLPIVERIDREKEERAIDPEIQQVIIRHLAEVASCDFEKITLETDVVSDLGLDSLDVGNICAFIDEKYHVPSLLPGEMKTVRDLCVAASGEEGLSGLNLPNLMPKKGMA